MICLYMLYASLMYTGEEALWGVLMVLTGVPLGLKFGHYQSYVKESSVK